MSQAGGPNSAGSVNIDFTGNVAPLEQAAKKAEQVVEAASAKMEQAATQATTAAASGSAGGAAPYMPGENFGPQYVAQFEQVTQATNKAAAASTAWHTGVVAGARSILGPIRQAIGVFVSLGSIFGLVAGAGYAVYQMFTAQSRAAAASKKEVEGLRKELESLFTTKPQTGVPLDIQEREEVFAAIQKQRQYDSDSFAKYRAGIISRNQLNKLEADSKIALEEEIANIQGKYIAEKNEAEKNSLLKFTASQKEAADDRAKYVANLLGGEAEEYIKAQIEIRKAQETVDADLLDARIALIEQERDKRIQAMADAAKKIADDEIEQAKRVAAEKIRLMNDFYRQQREAQAESTRVESFFAGNQGQSFSLANRQRTAIEGQLPSVNYQGAE